MKQDPVAWMTDKNQIISNAEKEKYEITYGDFCIPLYTAPVASSIWDSQRIAYEKCGCDTCKKKHTAPRELSDEEIKEVIKQMFDVGHFAPYNLEMFARAILKKASEK